MTTDNEKARELAEQCALSLLDLFVKGGRKPLAFDMAKYKELVLGSRHLNSDALAGDEDIDLDPAELRKILQGAKDEAEERSMFAELLADAFTCESIQEQAALTLCEVGHTAEFSKLGEAHVYVVFEVVPEACTQLEL